MPGNPFAVASLDHLVLTVRDREASCRFYENALGMERISFNGRTALRFGECKINLHEAGHELSPHAARPLPGSADLCFLTATPLQEVIRRLDDLGIAVEEGPVPRTGAVSDLLSVYVRDPDGNLIEIANPAQAFSHGKGDSPIA